MFLLLVRLLLFPVGMIVIYQSVELLLLFVLVYSSANKNHPQEWLGVRKCNKEQSSQEALRTSIMLLLCSKTIEFSAA
jgi:hypothetical protein